MNRLNPHNDLADHIRKELIREIKTGRFSDAHRLPPENKLAEEYQVSRNVIRDCLAQLQREGFVSRRPGVGTIINHEIAACYPRLDLSHSLGATLEMFGKEVDVSGLRVFEAPEDEEITRRMNLKDGERMLGIERIFSADGEPVIYCCDYLKTSILPDREFTPDDFVPSTFSFLREVCRREVYNCLSELRAVLAPDDIAKKLKITGPEPLLYLSEVDYQYDGEPLIYIREYLKDRTIPQWILRQVI